MLSLGDSITRKRVLNFTRHCTLTSKRLRLECEPLLCLGNRRGRLRITLYLNDRYSAQTVVLLQKTVFVVLKEGSE